MFDDWGDRPDQGVIWADGRKDRATVDELGSQNEAYGVNVLVAQLHSLKH